MHVSDAANQSADYLNEQADVLIAGNAPHQQALAQHIKNVVNAIKGTGETADPTSDLETKIKNLQESVLKLHDERDKAREELEQLSGKHAITGTELESVTRLRDELKTELDETTTLLDETNKLLDEAHAETEELQAKIDDAPKAKQIAAKLATKLAAAKLAAKNKKKS